jgi:hypothetical protein
VQGQVGVFQDGQKFVAFGVEQAQCRMGAIPFCRAMLADYQAMLEGKGNIAEDIDGRAWYPDGFAGGQG